MQLLLCLNHTLLSLLIFPGTHAPYDEAWLKHPRSSFSGSLGKRATTGHPEISPAHAKGPNLAGTCLWVSLDVPLGIRDEKLAHSTFVTCYACTQHKKWKDDVEDVQRNFPKSWPQHHPLSLGKTSCCYLRTWFHVKFQVLCGSDPSSMSAARTKKVSMMPPATDNSEVGVLC